MKRLQVTFGQNSAKWTTIRNLDVKAKNGIMSGFLLSAPKGANKQRHIVGRGASSGMGTTGGRGNKGQQSRSGGKIYIGFEGGQMPLFRRIARRGFSNYPFKKEYAVVNLRDIELKYTNGETVDKKSLIKKRLLKQSQKLLKILGSGDIFKKLVVKADKMSAFAKEKIEKANGTTSVADE